MNNIPTTQEIINIASEKLCGLNGQVLNAIILPKPESVEYALYLSKIISKLSPLNGNLIEINAIEYLNQIMGLQQFGTWERQDPGFPDAIFKGIITPTPGFEIKAWFPFATEITARFKDSQKHFLNDETYVAILAWLPEFILYGKPMIIGTCIVSGMSVAKARDAHYHNPPDYIILEPGDTSARTSNLQQTNTNGYKLQETSPTKIADAQSLVASWGQDAKEYKITDDYQRQIKYLQGQYNYRLDTNFAKIDRIEHQIIETFKQQIYAKQFHGKTIGQWNRLLTNPTEENIIEILNIQ